MMIIPQVTLLLGAEEWSSHETQQIFREVAEYNQQMAGRQASDGTSSFTTNMALSVMHVNKPIN